MSEFTDKLAEELFDCGGEPDSPCTRIEFKAGALSEEVAQGGFDKDALKRFLERAEKRIDKKSPPYN